MKRIALVFLVILFIIGVSGCKIETEEEPIVLIGSPCLCAEGSSLGIDEISELWLGFDETAEMQKFGESGEIKKINLFGVDVEAKYLRTQRMGEKRLKGSDYITENNFQITVNADTGDSISFFCPSNGQGQYVFPDGYEIKTNPATLNEMKNYFAETISTYYPDINLEEYVINVNRSPQKNDSTEGFDILYEKYIDGIKVNLLSFFADRCGNIYYMYVSDPQLTDKVNISGLTDEKLIAGAKKRIDEYYEGHETVAYVKDFKVVEKKLSYLAPVDLDAIDFRLEYTRVCYGGIEYKTHNQFYYLFDGTKE